MVAKFMKKEKGVNGFKHCKFFVSILFVPYKERVTFMLVTHIRKEKQRNTKTTLLPSLCPNICVLECIVSDSETRFLTRYQHEFYRAKGKKVRNRSIWYSLLCSIVHE